MYERIAQNLADSGIDCCGVEIRDFQMLEAISRYHGTSKSAMVTGLIRKEFWRVFPNGTDTVPLDAGAKVSES